MQLRYATVTGVARDDLPDEGAWLHAETVRADPRAQSRAPASRSSPPTSRATPTCSPRCSRARPEVFAHNVETVPRIFKRIRPAFRYERSLDVLTQAPRRRPDHEVEPDPRHGRGARTRSSRRCRTCTTRAPTSSRSRSTCGRAPRHLPVDRWVRPEEFVELKEEAEQIGFLGVLAGPLVRSSYRAGRLWAQSMHAKGRDIPDRSPIWPTPRSGSRRRSADASGRRLRPSRTRSEAALAAGILVTMARTKDNLRSEGARPHQADVAGLPDDPPLRLERAVAHAPRHSSPRCSSASALALWLGRGQRLHDRPLDRRGRARRRAARAAHPRPPRRARGLLADRGPARRRRRGAAERPARRLDRQRDADRRERQDAGRRLPRGRPWRRRAHQRGPASRARSACSTTSSARSPASCRTCPSR